VRLTPSGYTSGTISFTDDGRVDLIKVKPLARLGYLDYTTIDRLFEVEPELGGLRHNKAVAHGRG